MTYEQALKDWKTLWKIDCASDMTVGYVDQEDLDRLLHFPTKKTAKECLCRQIGYWFQAGTESNPVTCNPGELIEKYPHVRVIAERHGII